MNGRNKIDTSASQADTAWNKEFLPEVIGPYQPHYAVNFDVVINTWHQMTIAYKANLECAVVTGKTDVMVLITPNREVTI